MTARTLPREPAAVNDVAAALVLTAARELDPPDGHVPEPGPLAATSPAHAARDEHAWRDAAIVMAVRRAWQDGNADGVRALADGFAALLLLVPRRTPGGLVMVPAGIAERRARGSFATPAGLAAALARHALPDDGGPGAATCSVPRLVDPACGAGALLRAGFARMVDLGRSPSDALAALHGVDADPAAVAVCRAVLAVDAEAAGASCHPDDLAASIVCGDALLGPGARGPGPDDPGVCGPDAEPVAPEGLAWHRAFPQALAVDGFPPEPVTGWRGGFDALLANPPWERLKVTGRDWAGAPPEQLRATLARTARWLREAGRHPLTGAGELNAYLPFIETCWRLLGSRGRAGIVVPSGVAADRSAARLLDALLAAGSLERLHLLAPGAVQFDGVASRIGVAVLVLRSGAHPASAGGDGPESQDGARTPVLPAEVAVGLEDPSSPPGARAWTLHRDVPWLVNPNTGTPPLFGSARDARIVTTAYRRWPVLRRRAGTAGPARTAVAADLWDADPWHLQLVTPLHMTRDARWFRTAPGPGLLPLWEAKHAGLLDHRGGRTPHRYWVPAEVVEQRYGQLTARGWLAGYRNVTTVEAPRTLLPCALPVGGVGNSFPLLSAPQLPLLLSALASLPVDYLVRQKHAGANLNFFKLEQVAVPPPEAYQVPAPWQPGTTIESWVLSRFADAVPWDPGLAGLAAELRHAGVDLPAGADQPDEARTARRAQALADLDAVHAHLLGLDRCDLEHVLSTFAALRVREERTLGRFATADRVLGAFDRLAP